LEFWKRNRSFGSDLAVNWGKRERERERERERIA
jgi:hypothetical protein